MSNDNTKKPTEQPKKLPAPAVEEVPVADLDDVAGGGSECCISGCTKSNEIRQA